MTWLDGVVLVELEGSGGGGLVFHVVVEGVAGVFPGVEASAEWADAIYAELVQLQGELGVVSSLGQVQSRMKSRSRGMMSLWSLSSLGPMRRAPGRTRGAGR